MKKQESLIGCGQKACQQLFEKVMDSAGKPNWQQAGCPDCTKAAKALEADLAALHRAALRHTPPMPGPVRLPVATNPKKPFWVFMPKPVLAFAASLVLVLGLAVGMGTIKTGGPPVVEGPGATAVTELAAGDGKDPGPGDYQLDRPYILDVDYLILAGEMDLLASPETYDEGNFFDDFLNFIAPLAEDKFLLQESISQKETSHV